MQNYRAIRRDKLAMQIAKCVPITECWKECGFETLLGARKAADSKYVRGKVAEILGEAHIDEIVNVQEITQFFANVMRADLRNCVDENNEVIPLHAIPEIEAAALIGYKMGKYGPELKFESKVSAAMHLAKMLGAYIEKQEVSGPNGGPITTEMNPHQAAEIYKAML